MISIAKSAVDISEILEIVQCARVVDMGSSGLAMQWMRELTIVNPDDWARKYSIHIESSDARIPKWFPDAGGFSISAILFERVRPQHENRKEDHLFVDHENCVSVDTEIDQPKSTKIGGNSPQCILLTRSIHQRCW